MAAADMFYQMDSHTNKHSVAVFLMVLFLIVDSLANPVLFDPCPDNGMRKPPRFGKRTPQVEPCVRGPDRRNAREDRTFPKGIRYEVLAAMIDRLKSQLNSEYNDI